MNICPCTTRRSRLSSRGAALIMVLASLLALSGLVLKAMESTFRQSRDTSLLTLEYQSGLQARGGLDIAVALLSRTEAEELAPREQGWAGTWEDRGLRVTIVPCSARLNLNILSAAEEYRERAEQAVLSIFEDQRLTRSEMDHLLFWMGALELDGQESHGLDLVYQEKNLEYSPPQRELSRPEELLLVPGFFDMDKEWVRKFFTVWGEAEKIDINFASEKVVLALLPELEPYWGRIESLRRDSGITHPNQLLDTGMDIGLYNRVLPFISFEPRYFEVLVEVREGAWYEKHRYILEQESMDPDSPPEVLVRDVLEKKQL